MEFLTLIYTYYNRTDRRMFVPRLGFSLSLSDLLQHRDDLNA